MLFVIVVLLASIPAYAKYSGGTGKPNDPYQIATVKQLVSIGSDSRLLDKCFVLVNDLDLDPNLPGSRIFSQAAIAPDLAWIIHETHSLTYCRRKKTINT